MAPRRQYNRRIFQATTHLRFVAKVHLLFFRDPTPYPRSSLLDLTMADTRECVIRIPYPTPAVYSCPVSHMAFKQALKHLQIAKHVVDKHPGHETKLICAMCNAEFTNARSAGRHKCEGETAPQNEVAEVILTEDSAIYLHPPGPSQCPLCTWISQAKDTAAVTSIEKHLTRSHQTAKPKRLWKCRSCNTIAGGIKMRTHICETQSELPPTPSTQSPIPTPTHISSPNPPHTHPSPLTNPSSGATAASVGSLENLFTQGQRTEPRPTEEEEEDPPATPRTQMDGDTSDSSGEWRRTPTRDYSTSHMQLRGRRQNYLERTGDRTPPATPPNTTTDHDDDDGLNHHQVDTPPHHPPRPIDQLTTSRSPAARQQPDHPSPLHPPDQLENQHAPRNDGQNSPPNPTVLIVY